MAAALAAMYLLSLLENMCRSSFRFSAPPTRSRAAAATGCAGNLANHWMITESTHQAC
jgi:hypothetical protein